MEPQTGAGKILYGVPGHSRRVGPLPRLELCHKLGVFYILEQPSSSLLWHYGPVFRLLKRHGARCVKCSLGAYGARTLKEVSWIQICLNVDCTGKDHRIHGI